MIVCLHSGAYGDHHEPEEDLHRYPAEFDCHYPHRAALALGGANRTSLPAWHRGQRLTDQGIGPAGFEAPMMASAAGRAAAPFQEQRAV